MSRLCYALGVCFVVGFLGFAVSCAISGKVLGAFLFVLGAGFLLWQAHGFKKDVYPKVEEIGKLEGEIKKALKAESAENTSPGN